MTADSADFQLEVLRVITDFFDGYRNDMSDSSWLSEAIRRHVSDCDAVEAKQVADQILKKTSNAGRRAESLARATDKGMSRSAWFAEEIWIEGNACLGRDGCFSRLDEMTCLIQRAECALLSAETRMPGVKDSGGMTRMGEVVNEKASAILLDYGGARSNDIRFIYAKDSEWQFRMAAMDIGKRIEAVSMLFMYTSVCGKTFTAYASDEYINLSNKLFDAFGKVPEHISEAAFAGTIYAFQKYSPQYVAFLEKGEPLKWLKVVAGFCVDILKLCVRIKKGEISPREGYVRICERVLVLVASLAMGAMAFSFVGAFTGLFGGVFKLLCVAGAFYMGEYIMNKLFDAIRFCWNQYNTRWAREAASVFAGFKIPAGFQRGDLASAF